MKNIYKTQKSESLLLQKNRFRKKIELKQTQEESIQTNQQN